MRTSRFKALTTRKIFAATTASFGILVSCVMANAEDLKSASELEAAATKRELNLRSQLKGEIGEKARAALKSFDENSGSTNRGMRSDTGSTRVVNGITTVDYPASGALLHGADRRTAQILCSGTLIGCKTFITAAHCFIDPSDPTNSKKWGFDKPQEYKVFLQHAGIFDVAKTEWMGPKDYVHPVTIGSRSDLSIVTLKKPVSGIVPIPLNRTAKSEDGTPGLIVGFGRTGGDNYDYGVKRTGEVKTGKCPNDNKYSANLVCWNYDAVIKAAGADSNTCNADSGGGLLVGSEELLVGVTSGGRKLNCLEGDRSYDTDVVSYQSWISKMLGDDKPKSACGNLPAIDVEEHVRGEEAVINQANPLFRRTFDVAAGIATLRVALNGEDDSSGRNDFDLYLIQGDSQDTNKAVCREDGSGQFGFCEVPNPAPGPWTAVVKRKKGEGLMQLVVTRLPAK